MASGSVEARQDLTRYALLSIVTAIVVIVMKLLAWRISGSVGLLSDALESLVNLAAAIAAFLALRVVARPADAEHNFGHSKAEYFSAVFEGCSSSRPPWRSSLRPPSDSPTRPNSSRWGWVC